MVTYDRDMKRVLLIENVGAEEMCLKGPKSPPPCGSTLDFAGDRFATPPTPTRSSWVRCMYQTVSVTTFCACQRTEWRVCSREECVRHKERPRDEFLEGGRTARRRSDLGESNRSRRTMHPVQRGQCRAYRETRERPLTLSGGTQRQRRPDHPLDSRSCTPSIQTTARARAAR